MMNEPKKNELNEQELDGVAGGLAIGEVFGAIADAVGDTLGVVAGAVGDTVSDAVDVVEYVITTKSR